MARTAKTNLRIFNNGAALAGSFDGLDLTGGLSGSDEGNGVLNLNGSGAGSGTTPTTPPESPNGSQTTFTFLTKPKWVSGDGANKFENIAWTYAGTTLTWIDGAPPVNSIVGFL